MRYHGNSIRVVIIVSAVAELMTAGCDRRRATPPPPRQTVLLTLPVETTEVVLSDKPVPVGVECAPAVVRGFGKYADVGFVTPIFVPIRVAGTRQAFAFETRPDGGSAFRVAFRVPQSERDALDLLEPSQRSSDAVQFCRVAAALTSIERSGVARLASFPPSTLAAYLSVEGKERQMTLVVPPNWPSGGEVIGSIDLSAHDRRDIERDLFTGFGVRVHFVALNRMRRTGCTEVIDLFGLHGLGSAGLKNGERAAVSLGSLKRLFQSLVASSTNADITGDCGPLAIFAPATPSDEAMTANCERIGDGVSCRFEGLFTVTPFRFDGYATVANKR